ncbi:gamma-glutamyltransferase family protein [Noviherbaspirillum saxi]|uniref:Gamma-glutamyltransferase family protein n=1 Tax=Noviherbaspirillum saxi TaxID=2320863 RepID=A0A3A3FSR5_9BURK|nr:gamma-glutamyltransferase family protein [Noviherbaspirillum saxi]RJF99257.1 gamma-glutamyltransferase family protein [Noviherbaspirillum saxi]
MVDFNWSNPYSGTRSPLFARNVVSTSHPLAAQAGLRMMLRGGNAVDAAIAAAAMLTVVEPVSCGLGGDAFALLWDGQQLRGLNASGPAPQGWTPEYFHRRHAGRIPSYGWDTVTVPGMVAGWVELSERFGKLPFAELFEPAIDVAERGHMIAPVVQSKWERAIPQLKDQPGFARAFMPGGMAPRTGENFVFGAAAHTLTRIAETHGEVFYRGELAEAMAWHARQHDAALTVEDLATFSPEWMTPISRDYGGYTVHEIPPNGQGITALIALGIVEQLEIGRYRLDSADFHHLQIEAIKLAFADTYRWVADQRAMTEVRPADLLDDNYLAERARRIDLRRAGTPAHGKPPQGGTVYLSAADESGMMISFIQSNFHGFGSGVVVPETGISLHNRGRGFSLEPGHPNCVAPGKRPFHTIIPGFLTRDGQAQLSFGVMGANMQPQGHLQTLVRMLTYGQQPQAACDAPRWKVNSGLDVDIESTMPPDVTAELAVRGHRVNTHTDSRHDFGAGQFVWKTADGYLAASDSRRDGQAVGF